MDTQDLSIGGDTTLNTLLGLYDAPAYVRRGLRVSQQREAVTRHCAGMRQHMLRWVKWRLSELRGAIGDPSELIPLLAEAAELGKLIELWQQFDLRSSVVGTSASPRRLRRRMRDACESLVRFNQKWRAFIDEVDLTHANRVVEDYNRYYLLEKECAMGSVRLARIGYRRLAPITRGDLLAQFPLLCVPRLAPRT